MSKKGVRGGGGGGNSSVLVVVMVRSGSLQVVLMVVWLGLESWSDTYTLFPRSHHMLSILRLGYVLGRHDPLGRRLESWFGLGFSHCQTRPTGQAVRIMVWLWLE